MPFLTPTMMGGKIGTALVTNFEAAHADVLETELIPVADGIIARLTGLAVPDDTDLDDQDPQITLYASWIVWHLMSSHIPGLEVDVVKYRKGLYDDAVSQLTDYKAEVRAAGKDPGIQYTTNPGVKTLP